MAKVIISTYSTFYDLKTGIEFHSALDHRTGKHVGIADVTAKQAREYAGRPKFQVLTDEEFQAFSTPQAIRGEPIVDSEADTPLGQIAGDEPPAPPAQTGTAAANATKVAADQAQASAKTGDASTSTIVSEPPAPPAGDEPPAPPAQ